MPLLRYSFGKRNLARLSKAASGFMVVMAALSCERGVGTLERLDGEKAVACLLVQVAFADLDSTEKAHSPRKALLAEKTSLTDTMETLSEILRQINSMSYPLPREWSARFDSAAKEGDRLVARAKVIDAKVDSLSVSDTAETEHPDIAKARSAWSARRAACELATRKYEQVGR